MRFLIVSILAFCAVAMPFTAAWAQAEAPAAISDARRAELNEQYKEGIALYEANRYADALPLLEQVADELESPNALLEVARCLHKMGRHVEAYETMVRTVDLATERSKTEPRYVPTIAAARDELPELEKHVGRVRVSVHPTLPEGAVLEIGGRPARVERVVAVHPGERRVELRAPGYVTAERDVTLVAGQLVDLTLNLVVATAQPTAPPLAGGVDTQEPEPGAEQATVTSGGLVRIIGYGVLGVGVVGWAALVAGGVLSDHKFSEVQDNCGDGPCTSEDDRDLIDEGQLFEVVANVGLGVGIAGTVAGTLMIIFGGPSDEPAPVTGGFGPGGGFVAYTGQF